MILEFFSYKLKFLLGYIYLLKPRFRGVESGVEGREGGDVWAFMILVSLLNSSTAALILVIWPILWLTNRVRPRIR